jgi:hypothetical protein
MAVRGYVDAMTTIKARSYAARTATSALAPPAIDTRAVLCTCACQRKQFPISFCQEIPNRGVVLHMTILFKILILAFLLLAVPGRSQAMISVENVSTNRAKELGVTFRATKNGEAGIKVWLEYKTEGELKDVTYVEVQIGDGESRIMSAQLKVTNPGSGTASVNFSAYPKYLPVSSLMIVVYHGPRGDVGYQFQIKDFLDLKKLP